MQGVPCHAVEFHARSAMPCHGSHEVPAEALVTAVRYPVLMVMENSTHVAENYVAKFASAGRGQL